MSELILIPPRELPINDSGVVEAFGLSVKCIDEQLVALDATNKHLAYLKSVADHCTSLITAIALAHASRPG